MNLYSGHINHLIDELAALPGIGNKSAQRLAFYIIGMSPERVKKLSDSIVEARPLLQILPESDGHGGLSDLCGSGKGSQHHHGGGESAGPGGL